MNRSFRSRREGKMIVLLHRKGKCPRRAMEKIINIRSFKLNYQYHIGQKLRLIAMIIDYKNTCYSKLFDSLSHLCHLWFSLSVLSLWRKLVLFLLRWMPIRACRSERRNTWRNTLTNVLETEKRRKQLYQPVWLWYSRPNTFFEGEAYA